MLQVARNIATKHVLEEIEKWETVKDFDYEYEYDHFDDKLEYVHLTVQAKNLFDHHCSLTIASIHTFSNSFVVPD